MAPGGLELPGAVFMGKERTRMIRRCTESDLDAVMAIWLESNVDAHGFIPAEYWEGNFPAVRAMLPEAEVFVYQDESSGRVCGFIGLTGGEVQGIFVEGPDRSRGIGKQLLDFVKERRDRLALHVYQKNLRAADFYRREGFRVQESGVDEDTGEKDWKMVWQR